MSLVLLAVLGLGVGSFLSSLTWRIPRGIALTGRSFCPRCKKAIAWYDNIPLFSFLLLGGRCRHCRKKISLRYPAIELITSSFFVLVGASSAGRLGVSGVVSDYQSWLGMFTLPYFLFIVSALIALFVIDFEHKIIPDKILYPTIGVSLLVFLKSPSPTLFTNFSFGVFFATFLFFLHLLTSGRGMGLGDVQLALFLGLVLGFPGLLIGAFLAFLTGGVVGLILVLAKRAKFGKPIPFGPFLVVGALVALFASQTILKWYLP